MVDEVRRQFKEKPGILDGTEEPDVSSCIGIASAGCTAGDEAAFVHGSYLPTSWVGSCLELILSVAC